MFNSTSLELFIHKYRPLRARRVLEKAFGILSSFSQASTCHQRVWTEKSRCAVHNFVCEECGESYPELPCDKASYNLRAILFQRLNQANMASGY